jgi:hypothetical protein
MDTKLKNSLFFIFLFLILSIHQVSAASLPQNKQLALIFMDDIAIPIYVPKVKPDTTAPRKPTLALHIDNTTVNDTVYATISGEVGSTVYVNGINAGKIGSSGKIIVSLNTSGTDGLKKFSIVLRDTAGNRSDTLEIKITKIPDPKYDLEYKGLTFYYQNMSQTAYNLNQLDDSKFNQLNHTNKLLVANKLLSTLFFGYPQKELEEKINSGTFISDIRSGLEEERTDKAWLESYILDEDYFGQYSRWAEPQAINILSRFYAMKHLDNYFLKNWIAYILTQTIMFSPAYELESTHTPNIASVYNRIVTFLNEESGMRYISYVHMMSEDNWRRFRSPEDNGREMLEIFTLDMNDAHVPIAGQALQNWKLNTDSDTLEVSLNQNTQPLNLFGTVIVNGDDFYRELVKSSLFTKGVTKRLVDFFFTQTDETKKTQIINSIVASKPERWQDILLQIVFSEEYLLHSQRAKSAEETFYSLAKKTKFKHRKNTFYYLKDALDDMHQASMKYKLGKLKRVPLDTLSFAYYHKYIREQILLRRSNPDVIDTYDSWSRQGWDKSFTSFENFTSNSNNIETSLDNFVNYIFQTMISRKANNEELQFFKSHMIYEKNGEKYFYGTFNMFVTYDDSDKQTKERENRKSYIAFIVLDYISRLEKLYQFKEVK